LFYLKKKNASNINQQTTAKYYAPFDSHGRTSHTKRQASNNTVNRRPSLISSASNCLHGRVGRSKTMRNVSVKVLQRNVSIISVRGENKKRSAPRPSKRSTQTLKLVKRANHTRSGGNNVCLPVWNFRYYNIFISVILLFTIN